jgi:hypothetical protein
MSESERNREKKVKKKVFSYLFTIIKHDGSRCLSLQGVNINS